MLQSVERCGLMHLKSQDSGFKSTAGHLNKYQAIKLFILFCIWPLASGGCLVENKQNPMHVHRILPRGGATTKVWLPIGPTRPGGVTELMITNLISLKLSCKAQHRNVNDVLFSTGSLIDKRLFFKYEQIHCKIKHECGFHCRCLAYWCL